MVIWVLPCFVLKNCAVRSILVCILAHMGKRVFLRIKSQCHRAWACSTSLGSAKLLSDVSAVSNPHHRQRLTSHLGGRWSFLWNVFSFACFWWFCFGCSKFCVYSKSESSVCFSFVNIFCRFVEVVFHSLWYFLMNRSS